jgi:hypothetical protein
MSTPPDPKDFWKITLLCPMFTAGGIWMALTTKGFYQIVGLMCVLFFGMGGLWWLYCYWKNRSGSRP